MSELFVLRALVFAGGCFAASGLAFALAAVATHFVRRAGLRHALWLASFGIALLMPLATLMAPPSVVFEHRVAVPTYIEVPAMTEPAMHEASVAPAPSLPAIGMCDVAIALLIVWSIGALWTLSRLALGGLALSSLRRNSKPHALAPADLPKLDTRGRECELRLAAGEDGPITWGILRPIILLPHSAAHWPRARLQAVLLHELAHVRRRDSLTQLLAFIVCALHWPNPLAWIAARALRREAEIAADDQVIVSGVKPSAYAGELLGLASEFRGRRGLAVAMAGQSALEARVKSALAPNPSRSGVSPMDVFKVVSLGLAVTALLAFARPDVVDAQNVQQQALPAVEPAPAPAAEPAPANESAPIVIDDEEGPGSHPVIREVHDHHGHKVVRIVHLDHMTPADHARVEAAMVQAHRAEAEIARIQPEIDRAIAAARIDEKTARAMAKVEPQIRAEVARAIAKVQPAIRNAMVQVRISQKAMEASARAHARTVVRMEKHIDDETDNDSGADNDNDVDNDNDAGDDTENDAADDRDESEPEDTQVNPAPHE